MIPDLDIYRSTQVLVLSFVDSPTLSVEAAGAPVFSESEDITSARIKFANGCIANIVASRISLKTERRMRVFQSDTYATVDFDGPSIKIFTKAKDPRSVGISPIEIAEEDYQKGDPLEREIEAFVSAVIGGYKPLVSGEDGLETLKAANLVNESLRSHASFVDETRARPSGSKRRA